ncbi:MAG: hypothetical protein ACP5KI_05365 [Brevinematia bacterium]
MLFIIILFSLICSQLNGYDLSRSNYVKFSFSYSELSSISSLKLNIFLSPFRFSDNLSYSYFGLFKNYQNVGDYVVYLNQEEIAFLENNLVLSYEIERFSLFSILDYSFNKFYQNILLGGGIGINFQNVDVCIYFDKVDFWIGAYKLNFLISTSYNGIESLAILLSKDFQSKTLLYVESEIRMFELNNIKLNSLFSYSTCFESSTILPYGVGIAFYLPYMYKFSTLINFSDFMFSTIFSLEKSF